MIIKTIPDHFYRVPWKTGGRDMHGADCWGFIRLVAKAVFNKDFPLLSEKYNSVENRAELETLMIKNSMQFKIVETPEPGDVILFRICGFNSHVGIMLNSNDFAHMWKGSGVCVERYTGPLWLNRVQGFYRPD